MNEQPSTYIIQEIRDFVPVALRPWILIAFLLVFQICSGAYMAVASQMSSATALLRQDIMMAGYANLVGMMLVFTLMYRLKFRFSIKTSLIVCSIACALCCMICVHTTSVPLLVFANFVLGLFRMWGTFACNTTIQLWITPKRDMAVWFCYIYLVVQLFIQLSGLTSVYITFYTQWEYMHYFIIALLLAVALLTQVLFRHYRSMPKLPLLGIDWMGGILWGAAVMSAVFVFVYGEYYDWFDSSAIWIGTCFTVVCVVLNVWRASFIRHPFIENRVWKYRNVWLTFGLYILVDLLISPSHLFEYILAETILGYDAAHVVSLSVPVVVGIVVGAFVCYQCFALRHWKYKTMTTLGFFFILVYLLLMYFGIDYNLDKDMLYLPIFMRALGYEILAIIFLTALTQVAFPTFFQSLSVQAMMSACLGALVGETILHEVFKHVHQSNVLQVGSTLDAVNTQLQGLPLGTVYEALQHYSLLISMKEVYGWLCYLGIATVLACLLYYSSLRPGTIYPKFSTIRKRVKRQLRLGL